MSKIDWDVSPDGQRFTGFSKYYNSFTPRGRRNATLMTYTGVVLVATYFWLKPKKQPAMAEKK